MFRISDRYPPPHTKGLLDLYRGHNPHVNNYCTRLCVEFVTVKPAVLSEALLRKA